MHSGGLPEMTLQVLPAPCVSTWLVLFPVGSSVNVGSLLNQVLQPCSCGVTCGFGGYRVCSTAACIRLDQKLASLVHHMLRTGKRGTAYALHVCVPPSLGLDIPLL